MIKTLVYLVKLQEYFEVETQQRWKELQVVQLKEVIIIRLHAFSCTARVTKPQGKTQKRHLSVLTAKPFLGCSTASGEPY